MSVYNKRGILLLPKVIVLNPKDGYITKLRIFQIFSLKPCYFFVFCKKYYESLRFYDFHCILNRVMVYFKPVRDDAGPEVPATQSTPGHPPFYRHFYTFLHFPRSYFHYFYFSYVPFPRLFHPCIFLFRVL